MWDFVEYIKNVHAPKEHLEIEDYDVEPAEERTFDWFRSRIDPYAVRVICPCFPDPYSRMETHDYCSRMALFDGCPNRLVSERDWITDYGQLRVSWAEDSDPLLGGHYEKPDRTLEGGS